MRSIAVSIAIAVSLAPFVTCAREFRSSDVHPSGYPTVEAVAFMGRLIRERTGGRLNISTLGRSDQDSESFTIAEVRNGIIDMARVNVSPFHSTVPATVVPALSFLFKSTAHMRRVLDGPIGEEILAALENQGLIGLCFYDAGARSFYSAKGPIKSAASLQGKNVRVQQSRIWVATMQALGARATPMPYNQVYAALDSGTIDVAENNLPAYVTSRHFEVAKIYSLVEYTMAPSVVVFSKRIWDTLAKEEQEIIRASAKESVPHMRKLWDEREASARHAAEAAGVQIVTDIDKKSFSDILAPLHPVLLTDPRLQNMVKRVQLAD